MDRKTTNMDDHPKRRFSPYHMVGSLGTMLVVLIAASAGSNVRALIYLPGAMLVFGLTFFTLLASFGHDLFEFIADAVLTLFSKPAAPVPRFAEIAKFGSRYAVGAGTIGMLILIMRMLRAAADPRSLVLGLVPPILTALYAVIASELLFAFFYKVYSDPDGGGDTQPLPLREMALLVIVFLFVLSALLIIFLTFS